LVRERVIYAAPLKKTRVSRSSFDASTAQTQPFGEPLQHIINAYSYGDIWSRPQLDMKARSLAMVGITATLNKPNELKVHVNGALNNGATAEEVREVLLMVTLYAGLPTGIDAHKAALEVITARRPAPAAPAA
jgi:4-carboxymuconolactone decarboxylase